MFVAGRPAGGHVVAGRAGAERSGAMGAAGVRTRIVMNSLLIVADQHRADWLGSNPALPLRTPNLDALAQRGTHFDRAYTPSPLCGPSRACLASGMEYARCGVPNHLYDYPVAQPTYYRRLRDAGYSVLGYGKLDLHKSSLGWNLDGSRLMHEWGFTGGADSEGKRDAIVSGAKAPMGPYMAYLHQRGLADAHARDFAARRSYQDTFPTPLPDDAYSDNWIADRALTGLETLPSDRPWHLTVNFTGPHEPMDVTRAMQHRWEGVEFPLPTGDTGPGEAHQRIRRNYAAMIENIDAHVGRFLAAVEARGERERTLVAYTSDHGEMLGDHGLWAKSVPDEASIRIPLIVAGPGVKAGARVTAPVQLHDLNPTFLEAASLPPLPHVDGLSLWPLLRDDAAGRRAVAVSALADWRCITDGHFKLVQRTGEASRLFEVDADDLANEMERDLPEVAAGLARAVGSG